MFKLLISILLVGDTDIDIFFPSLWFQFFVGGNWKCVSIFFLKFFSFSMVEVFI